MGKDMAVWFLMVAILAAIIVICRFIYTCERYLDTKRRYIIREKNLLSLQEENKQKSSQYSTDMLELIKKLADQISLLEFQRFIDEREIPKVTQSNVRELAERVARNVQESINIDNIAIENTVFNKEFYNYFIIEYSINRIKRLWDHAILNEDEF